MTMTARILRVPRSLRRRVLPVLVAIVAVSVVGACGESAPEVGLKYVALGDSYVAGGGIATTTTECLRSDHDYPALLAAELQAAKFVDVSCGGATTKSVLHGTVQGSGSKLAPQIGAVTSDTDLITIGIGGNDSGVTPTLFTSCLIPPANTPVACRAAVAAIPVALATTGRSIVSTLREIKARAPKAQVVLVGYLRILPDSGTCTAIPIGSAEIPLVAKIETELEESLRLAANDAEVTFISVRTISTGHDACSGENAWVNGVTPAPGDGALLHPRAAGMRAVANEVFQQLRH